MASRAALCGVAVMIINREICGISCSCRGVPRKVETTQAEINKHGCHRDKPDRACCVVAIECASCKTRWTFILEVPEME